MICEAYSNAIPMLDWIRDCDLEVRLACHADLQVDKAYKVSRLAQPLPIMSNCQSILFVPVSICQLHLEPPAVQFVEMSENLHTKAP